MQSKKALFTFKPVEYMDNPHMFAGLALIDLSSGNIEKVLRIPAATFKSNKAFMANFVQGLSKDEENIYISGWNFVAVANISDFSVIDSFSTKEMADVHSLFVDENYIYVISTATECLICFDKKTKEKRWVWGPNERMLDQGARPFLPSLGWKLYKDVIRKKGLRKYVLTPQYKGEETRFVHKTSSPYYRHHFNNVFATDEHIYLNTKGWFDSTSSAVIKIDKKTFKSSFFAQPGTFIGSHDGIIENGHYYVTEADNNSVARVDLEGRNLKRYPLEPKGFFVRGMILDDEINYVGFTPLKSGKDECHIYGYTKDFSKKIREIRIPDLCGKGQKTAIHSMLKI